jgi:hypothetical protein
MSEQNPPGKSFAISKQEVWDAYLKVKPNKGSAGSGRVAVQLALGPWCGRLLCWMLR